jgi:hypothetical protein
MAIIDSEGPTEILLDNTRLAENIAGAVVDMVKMSGTGSGTIATLLINQFQSALNGSKGFRLDRLNVLDYCGLAVNNSRKNNSTGFDVVIIRGSYAY